MNAAVVSALRDEMRADPTVFVMGEDIGDKGGNFRATEGLKAEFGPERVRETPISEMGFLGAGLGAAISGLRPVVEIMFVDFLGVCLEMLATQAAKFRFLSAGTLKVPLTVRASMGAGMGHAASHSQTLEPWILSQPGVKLAVASGPRTAYGLLRSAIQDDNPVVVLEPRILYMTREEFEPKIIPLGQAEVVERGKDVTIVTTGQMLRVSLEAARQAEGWSAEVIDLLTLNPWDKATVLESVARTGRLVVVEENPFTGGWGTEIASYVSSQLFRQLKAPVTRVTTPDTPVPFAKNLQARFLPNAKYVGEQVGSLIKTDAVPKPWWEGEEVL
jgi:pyruvate/2-oxoglutarate/acetoin dehydrogenase E1 component